MAPPKNAEARPIQTLREHVTALEAAITLSLAHPDKEPVHRLRTSTRRIEAQLELLSLLPGLPDHSKSEKKVRKLLKRLRRAAGSVRDLDVQRSLIQDHSRSADSKELRRDARHLRQRLKEERASEAKHLGKLLAQEQQKLAPALEKLLRDLEPAAGLALPAQHLADLTQRWYEHNTPQLPPSRLEQLHTIRKSAKLARYITEAGAEETAQRFESLQEAGGTWHDLLTLRDIAKEHLGRKSALTQLFEQQHAQALDGYRKKLGLPEDSQEGGDRKRRRKRQAKV